MERRETELKSDKPSPEKLKTNKTEDSGTQVEKDSTIKKDSLKIIDDEVGVEKNKIKYSEKTISETEPWKSIEANKTNPSMQSANKNSKNMNTARKESKNPIKKIKTAISKKKMSMSAKQKPGAANSKIGKRDKLKKLIKRK